VHICKCERTVHNISLSIYTYNCISTYIYIYICVCVCVCVYILCVCVVCIIQINSYATFRSNHTVVYNKRITIFLIRFNIIDKDFAVRNPPVI